MLLLTCFLFSNRRRHTRCSLGTGVQTCALPIWGRLLDAEVERLGDARVQALETEGLVGAASAPAVLAYLFHRIGQRLDGSPTLIIIDEGWLILAQIGRASCKERGCKYVEISVVAV